MVELASDFLDRNTPVFRDDVCFFISQSGKGDGQHGQVFIGLSPNPLFVYTLSLLPMNPLCISYVPAMTMHGLMHWVI